MTTTTGYCDPWISPRIKIAALWTTTMLVFGYVDLFSLYRADVRSHIEAGEISGFTIGQGFLLGTTIYVMLPALMVALSLLLPARIARIANILLAAIYIPTLIAGAIGEWSYYLLGSAVEVATMSAILQQALTWPKQASEPRPSRSEHDLGQAR